MSLFANPTQHAANPPHTWAPVKVHGGWILRTADGTALDRFRTKRDALAGREEGWLAKLYDQESRWYAGENIPGWRPYADVVAEVDRNTEAMQTARVEARLAARAEGQR